MQQQHGGRIRVFTAHILTPVSVVAVRKVDHRKQSKVGVLNGAFKYRVPNGVLNRAGSKLQRDMLLQVLPVEFILAQMFSFRARQRFCSGGWLFGLFGCLGWVICALQ